MPIGTRTRRRAATRRTSPETVQEPEEEETAKEEEPKPTKRATRKSARTRRNLRSASRTSTPSAGAPKRKGKEKAANSAENSGVDSEQNEEGDLDTTKESEDDDSKAKTNDSPKKKKASPALTRTHRRRRKHDKEEGKKQEEDEDTVSKDSSTAASGDEGDQDQKDTSEGDSDSEEHEKNDADGSASVKSQITTGDEQEGKRKRSLASGKKNDEEHVDKKAKASKDSKSKGATDRADDEGEAVGDELKKDMESGNSVAKGEKNPNRVETTEPCTSKDQNAETSGSATKSGTSDQGTASDKKNEDEEFTADKAVTESEIDREAKVPRASDETDTKNDSTSDKDRTDKAAHEKEGKVVAVTEEQEGETIAGMSAEIDSSLKNPIGRNAGVQDKENESRSRKDDMESSPHTTVKEEAYDDTEKEDKVGDAVDRSGGDNDTTPGVDSSSVPESSVPQTANPDDSPDQAMTTDRNEAALSGRGSATFSGADQTSDGRGVPADDNPEENNKQTDPVHSLRPTPHTLKSDQGGTSNDAAALDRSREKEDPSNVTKDRIQQGQDRGDPMERGEEIGEADTEETATKGAQHERTTVKDRSGEEDTDSAENMKRKEYEEVAAVEPTHSPENTDTDVKPGRESEADGRPKLLESIATGVVTDEGEVKIASEPREDKPKKAAAAAEFTGEKVAEVSSKEETLKAQKALRHGDELKESKAPDKEHEAEDVTHLQQKSMGDKSDAYIAEAQSTGRSEPYASLTPGAMDSGIATRELVETDTAARIPATSASEHLAHSTEGSLGAVQGRGPSHLSSQEVDSSIMTSATEAGLEPVQTGGTLPIGRIEKRSSGESKMEVDATLDTKINTSTSEEPRDELVENETLRDQPDKKEVQGPLGEAGIQTVRNSDGVSSLTVGEGSGQFKNGDATTRKRLRDEDHLPSKQQKTNIEMEETSDSDESSESEEESTGDKNIRTRTYLTDLNRIKLMLFSLGNRVHRKHGYERLFQEYWAALSARIEGKAASAAKSKGTIERFLRTRSLRKLHNRLVLGLLQRCSASRLPRRFLSLTDAPSHLMARIRPVSRPSGSSSSLDSTRPAAEKKSKKRTILPPFLPAVSTPTSLESRCVKPNMSSATLPGALIVDPFARALAQNANMKMSENAIWLLVVAMKEFSQTVLKSALASSKALERGHLPPKPLMRPQVLGKKRNFPPKENKLPEQERSPENEKLKCISAFDIHSTATNMPMSATGLLGGCSSRINFESGLYAAFDSNMASRDNAFTEVKNFITTSLTPVVSKRQRTEGNLPMLRGAAESSTADGVGKPAEPLARKGALQQDRQSMKSPFGGLGRGAKDLAALKARASFTQKNKPTGPVGAGNGPSTVKTDPLSKVAATQSTTAQPSDGSIGRSQQIDVVETVSLPKQEIAAGITSTEAQVKSSDEKQTTMQPVVVPRRGKGFGVKNLAAMRARTITHPKPEEGSNPPKFSQRELGRDDTVAPDESSKHQDPGISTTPKMDAQKEGDQKTSSESTPDTKPNESGVSKTEGDADASVTGHLNDEVTKDAATKNELVELSTESTNKRPEGGATQIVTSKGDSGTVNMEGVKSDVTNNAVADSDADTGIEADKKGNVTTDSATKLGPETEDGTATIENDRKEDEAMEGDSSTIAEQKAKDDSLIQVEGEDKTTSVTTAKNEPTAEGGSIDVIEKEDRKGDIVEDSSTKVDQEAKSETDSSMQVDAKDEVVDKAGKDEQEANKNTITDIQTDTKGDADETTKKEDQQTRSETDSALLVDAKSEVVDSISRKNEVEAKSETISGILADMKGHADAGTGETTKKDDQKARNDEGDADAGETLQKDDPKAEDGVEAKK